MFSKSFRIITIYGDNRRLKKQRRAVKRKDKGETSHHDLHDPKASIRKPPIRKKRMEDVHHPKRSSVVSGGGVRDTASSPSTGTKCTPKRVRGTDKSVCYSGGCGQSGKSNFGFTHKVKDHRGRSVHHKTMDRKGKSKTSERGTIGIRNYMKKNSEKTYSQR